jgi:hypothetical protein
LQADAAVDAGDKVNPVPVGSLGVLAGAGVDAGDRTGFDAIGDSFAGFSDDAVWQGVLSSNAIATVSIPYYPLSGERGKIKITIQENPIVADMNLGIDLQQNFVTSLRRPLA